MHFNHLLMYTHFCSRSNRCLLVLILQLFSCFGSAVDLETFACLVQGGTHILSV